MQFALKNRILLQLRGALASISISISI